MSLFGKFHDGIWVGGMFRVSMPDVPESPDVVDPSPVVVSADPNAPAVPASPDASSPTSPLSPVAEVTVTVSVVLGETQMTVRDATRISEGKIIPLDRQIDDPLQLLVNGYPVAHGEVVQVDNQFGLRITETLDSEAEKNERF